MPRPIFLLCLLLIFQSAFCQWPVPDLVEEYQESKNGITLTTFISLHDSAGRQVLDAFLNHLSKKLKRPNNRFKILILADYKTRTWNAAIGVDTVRFDYNAMIDYFYPPHKENKVVEVVLQKTEPNKTPIETSKQTPAPNWNVSYDKTANDLGLKILYKLPLSDTNIFFDRIYSLTQFGIDHFEKIKKQQTKMEMKYDGYPLSVLSIDTIEIKKIPLKSSGFNRDNIVDHEKGNWPIWIISSTVLLVSVLLILFRNKHSVEMT